MAFRATSLARRSKERLNCAGSATVYKSAWARGAALIRLSINHLKGIIVAADIKPHGSGEQDLTVHTRDYAGFITLLKWTTVIVAVLSAIVIYAISN